MTVTVYDYGLEWTAPTVIRRFTIEECDELAPTVMTGIRECVGDDRDAVQAALDVVMPALMSWNPKDCPGPPLPHEILGMKAPRL